MSLEFSYKREILRKILHLSTCIFALMLLCFGKKICIPIFLSLAILFFALDFLRLKNKYIQRFYNIFFGIVTKHYEERQLTSASYVFLTPENQLLGVPRVPLGTLFGPILGSFLVCFDGSL